MLRTGERYNFKEVEARWQAAWAEVTAPAAATTLDEARSGVLADVFERYRQARAIKVLFATKTIIRCVGGTDAPHVLVATYGLDAVRLALVSDVPADRPLTWSDGGIDGAWRYLQRLWRLAAALHPALAAPHDPLPPRAAALSHRIDRTTLAVTVAMDAGHVHKAVALLRALGHALADMPVGDAGAPWVLRRGLTRLVRMFAPVLPHLCEELWRALEERGPVRDAPWPDADPAVLNENAITIAVQVNGKRRGELRLPRDANGQAMQRAALALPAVARHIRGQSPRKVIVVPNRILNVVI